VRLPLIVFALALLSMPAQAADYVNVSGALLRPGMTQAEVESALLETGAGITRTNDGPDADWFVMGSKASPSGRDCMMSFSGGKLRIVSRTVTIQKGAEPAPNAASIVTTLFSLLRSDGSERGHVAFVTEEMAPGNRTVAFFVGEKIFMLSVTQPVGSHSLMETTVQLEERMEAKDPR